MRRLAVIAVSLALTTSVFGKEVFLAISGKANGFFTDARIFNPSFTKDITVNAQYLPQGNQNNTGATVVPLAIPKRSMKVYDDAVQSIFGGQPGLGAIRLTSDDDFIATQRIYKDARLATQGGTLGQFVPGLDISAAKTRGILIQLKSGAATLGNFRTNWGGVNPSTNVANVTLKLYDGDNALVSTKTAVLQPYAIQAPTSIADYFGNPPNLTDAWISFESDHPVFLYGSVVDNGSEDPTFIAAADDSGTPPPPPPPQAKTVLVFADDGSFGFEGLSDLHLGDEVTFTATGTNGVHGFRLHAPDGSVLFTLDPLGANPTSRTITLPANGTYIYICTRPTCSGGHAAMTGEFTVGPSGPDNPGDRY